MPLFVKGTNHHRIKNPFSIANLDKAIALHRQISFAAKSADNQTNVRAATAGLYLIESCDAVQCFKCLFIFTFNSGSSLTSIISKHEEVSSNCLMLLEYPSICGNVPKEFMRCYAFEANRIVSLMDSHLNTELAVLYEHAKKGIFLPEAQMACVCPSVECSTTDFQFRQLTGIENTMFRTRNNVPLGKETFERKHCGPPHEVFSVNEPLPTNVILSK
jgi:hypothetical protein